MLEYNENTGSYELTENDTLHQYTLDELVEELYFQRDAGLEVDYEN